MGWRNMLFGGLMCFDVVVFGVLDLCVLGGVWDFCCFAMWV